MKDVPCLDTVECRTLAGWPFPAKRPLELMSIGSTELRIIKIPNEAVNKFGNTAFVEAIGENAFAGKGDTDNDAFKKIRL